MIKINLARKKKKAGFSLDLSSLFSRSKSTPTADDTGTGSSDGFNFRKSAIVRFVSAALSIYLLSGTIEDVKNEELGKIKKELAKVDNEITQIQAQLNKMTGYEQIKQQLEQDEASIRTKYEVITKLIKERSGTASMLLQIAKFIPEEVWLTNLVVTDSNIKFIGGTTGYNEVSDFIKSLSNSSYLEGISLSNIQDTIGVGNTRTKLKSFEVSAKRRRTL